MGFSLLLACIVVTLITIHVVYILHKSRGKRRSSSSAPLPPPVPGPAGHPVLRNLLYVIGPLRRNPHRALAALAEVHGPVVSLRLGLTRTLVVVSSPAVAREALVKHDAALAARLVPDNVRALSYSATSLVFLPSSDHLWRQGRAVIGAGFSSGRGLDRVRPVLERHAGRLAGHFAACAGRPVVVREALNGTVLNVISNVLFSRDVVDVRVGAPPQMFKGLIAPVLQGWSKPSVCDAFSFLAPLEHLLGSRRLISVHLAKLFKFFDKEIIERRLASGEKHDDLLDVLLARLAMSKLTRQQIITFLTDMFIAASDTSTVTVQRAMAQLLCHPEKMEKVRTELRERLGSKSNDIVKESDLDKLPYVQAVVKETLRLHPAVPLIPREVVADGVSLGGFAVPNGTGIVVNLWAIGRDPEAWSQPEEFMPERFLVEKAAQGDKGTDFAYRPFGAGRRVCPGMDYTARSVPLLLASILHKTEWQLPDGMAPEDIDLSDRYGTVLDLATPLRAVPVPIV